ncbi:hypothetical protein FMM05_20060 [Flavobacterium zepuense]|uniref:YubB ferredoxin-like domain-containing protein n=1 Tax=Flavobacterium zepuense TaxID=2593302 RepID=A0A552UTM2_9FLAO|nr:hypothetical protein [Flavobacterium zepuense]TRW21554.1 hypothetical protein FMM05_20060 [Flavobacterium zepuense]
MANWCSNTVVFEGNPRAIEQIQGLFRAIADKQKIEDAGYLPDFNTTRNGHFFDIYWNEGDIGIFQYLTRWAPNIETLIEIADHYQATFTLGYEEMGCRVYGLATYRNVVLTDIFLEHDDFETYWFNEETDLYHFEGETYESDCEILETLLERKTAK